MIPEDRVLELFAQDNPIPSVDDLDLDHMVSPAYLATLERKSSEMVQVETNQIETEVPKRRSLAWVAAAAVVLVVAVGILLFAAGQEPDVVTPTEQQLVIDQFLAATDYAELASTMSPEGIAGYRSHTGFLVDGEAEIAEEMAANQILGIEMSGGACESVGETVMRCEVTRHSHVTDAFGEDPKIVPATFNFSPDGLISTYPNLPDAHPAFEIRPYAQDAGLEATLNEVCNGQSYTEECATFIIDNLDGWVTWSEG